MVLDYIMYYYDTLCYIILYHVVVVHLTLYHTILCYRPGRPVAAGGGGRGGHEAPLSEYIYIYYIFIYT